MTSESHRKTPIVIVGAGISGLILGLALHERHIKFQIYEQASNYSHYGAGLNMNPAGVRAVRASSAAASRAFETVRTPHHPTREDFYFAYTDGENIFELLTDEGKGGIKRSRFIEELSKEIPADAVHFRKCLCDLYIAEEGHTVLVFEDATMAHADVVVGCDGIKSKIRGKIVGSHPSAEPTFTNTVGYRSLMSKSDARRLLGPALADCAHFRTGKGIGYVSYPITGGEHNSFAIYKLHDGDWPDYPRLSTRTSKEQLLSGVEDPEFRAIASSLADELDVWAVYDMAASPLPTFSKERLTLVGDAAHASSPNLGAGAGVSIEDATILAELLAEIYKKHTSFSNASHLRDHLNKALEIYSDSRMGRSQWLVESSRHLGMANLGQPVWDGSWDWDRYQQDTTDGYHTVWLAQIDEMIAQSKEKLHAALHEQRL